MKLKSALLLGFVLSLGGSALLAETDPSLRTYGVRNGRAWQGWSEDEQLGYFVGYMEGASNVCSLKNIDTSSKENSDLRLLWPDGMKVGETMHALDRFYATHLTSASRSHGLYP